jgi:alkylated DNA repair dioxygenase AlkB
MFKRDDLPGDAWIDYDPNWIASDRASELLQQLLDELAWEQRPIMVFGKPVMQPRLIAWAGELPYRYSGQTLEVLPISGVLAQLTHAVSEAVGVPFNHVLGNRYRDGKDSMGWHADDERELGRQPVIAALSLGVGRKFMLHRKRNKRQKRHYTLSHGSLLVMGGACQHTWRHAVPKMTVVTDERINLTFRLLKGPPGWRELPRAARSPQPV